MLPKVCLLFYKIHLKIAEGYTGLKNEFFYILVFAKFIILANTLRKEFLAKKNFGPKKVHFF